jgi:hypothetical protein
MGVARRHRPIESDHHAPARSTTTLPQRSLGECRLSHSESGQHGFPRSTTTLRSAKWRWWLACRGSDPRGFPRSTTTPSPAAGWRWWARSESGHRQVWRSTMTSRGSAWRLRQSFDRPGDPAPETTARLSKPPETTPPQVKCSLENGIKSRNSGEKGARNYNLYITHLCTKNTPLAKPSASLYRKIANPHGCWVRTWYSRSARHLGPNAQPGSRPRSLYTEAPFSTTRNDRPKVAWRSRELHRGAARPPRGLESSAG